MSSLTLSILILAVIVALGVGAHSLWVLQREKKKLAQLSPKGPDAETATGKASAVGASSGQRFAERPSHAEPHFSSKEAGDEETNLNDPARQDRSTPDMHQGDLLDDGPNLSMDSSLEKSAGEPPVLASGEEGSLDLNSRPSVEPSTAKANETLMPPGVRILHDEADCMIDIALLQPSSGDRLIGLTKSIRRAGGKPVAFEGYSHGVWEGIRYGANYQNLRAGILLANRQGPLNAMEFSELNSKLLSLGAQLGVPINMPDMNAILQRARSLDGMLAECDVQLGLAVDCPRALSPADLASLAKRIGLHERGNNRYALLSDQAEVIYSVALGDKAQRLQLMFDVPRVPPDYKPWWKMAEAAHQAATFFDGRITDDSGRELSEQSFRNVAIALEGRQQALEEAGVPAGSPLAMRVFN